MSQEEDEKKATEQLLSGFDRPGRTPRAPRVERRDFVAHYSGRSAAAPGAEAPPPASKRNETSSHERATVLVPRRSGLRNTMTWVVAVVGMILFGVTVAVLSTPQLPASPPLPPIASPPVAPTSATTITSADPETEEPADPVVATPATASPKKTAPTTTITSGASSAPTIKSAPRDDFIRDM